MSIYFSYYPKIAGKRTVPIDKSYVKEKKLKFISKTANARIYEDKTGTQYGVFLNKD